MDIIQSHSFQLNMFNYEEHLKYTHIICTSFLGTLAGRLIAGNISTGDWRPPGRILQILLALSVPPGACVCGFLYEDLLKLRFTNTSPGRRQLPLASREGRMWCPCPPRAPNYLQCLYKCRQSLCCLHTIPASCPVKGCAWLSIFLPRPVVTCSNDAMNDECKKYFQS